MMITGVRQLFVDTNVLVYSANTLSPWHAPAIGALQDASAAGTEIFTSPQILREYLSVATRSTPGNNGVPLMERARESHTRLIRESR